ncbi:MAG TPA: hypothetical protein VMR97_01850 [Acidimicrobiales bacterium]|nr:hypothetical protein [Acidimicrobiales bacterium]
MTDVVQPPLSRTLGQRTGASRWRIALIGPLIAVLTLVGLGLMASPSQGQTIACGNPPTGDSMSDGQIMCSSNQAIHSSNVQYELVMQSDGNLVIYFSGRAIWSSGSYGNAGDYLAMQSDGNLVIRSSSGTALWNTGTYGNAGDHLAMQSDGNLVIYSSSGSALWASNTLQQELTDGQILSQNQYIRSSSYKYQLVMQSDGNIVIYDPSAIWSTGTNGNSGAHLAMQPDGNLVVYSSSGLARWATGTSGNPGDYAAMQSDGNFVIYSSSGRALWASNTQPTPQSPGPAPRTTGIVPPANPSANIAGNFQAACNSGGPSSSQCINAEVASINGARSDEGVGAIQLPSTFESLSPGEQLFVLINSERVDRGLPPVVGMVDAFNQVAQSGADANTDPAGCANCIMGGYSVSGYGAIWAADGNTLWSDYDWMYDDGLGGINILCQASDTSQCWGHRDNILVNYSASQLAGHTLVMGAGEAPGPEQQVSDAAIFALVSGAPSYTYTWAQAEAVLGGHHARAARRATPARGAPYGAKSWGDNSYGELGLGIKCLINCDVPMTVTGLSGVKATSAGRDDSYALLNNGTVKAWGANESGQLGDGTISTTGCFCTDVPVTVRGLSGVKAISAGEDVSFALLNNGTVKAWGLNEYGDLGDGTISTTGCLCSDVPVTVRGLSGVKAISAGEDVSFALLNNGTVKAWGSNGNAQLGDGTISTNACQCSDVPVTVKGLSGVQTISAGWDFGLAEVK